MREKILLVGWDGADWALAEPLMRAGRMPQLQHMIDHGVSGILRSAPPYLSPMLWTTIATGKSPAEHGIVGFREYDEASQSLRPISSRSRRCKAIWNIFSQEGWKTHVLGWFATFPAERINGVVVSDFFANLHQTKEQKEKRPKGCVYPEEKTEDLLPLSISPSEVDPALIRFFIPRIEEINLQRDPRPSLLRRRLAELYSYHNAAVALLQEESADFLTIYYHFLDWVCHDFMTLAPPQRPEVTDRDFSLYGGVVDAAYVLQDLLLRDLLRHAGDGVNCVVVSDHGFFSGDRRPAKTPGIEAGIAAWHRSEGILVGAGPMFRSGVKDVHMRQVDLAPTLLHGCGLPVGVDMPGRVLTSALTRSSAVDTIPTWETRGSLMEKVDEVSGDADLSDALLKQFEELGYVSTTDGREELAGARTRRENAWNLGVALMGEERLEEALPFLEEAFFHHPEAPHRALPLARCQARLGLIEESRVTEESLWDYGPLNGELCYQLGLLSRLRADYSKALSHLDQSDALGFDQRLTSLERGLILLLSERFEEAENVFRTQVTEHPGLSAELGLCRALLMSDKLEEAEARLSVLKEHYAQYGMIWFTWAQVMERTGRMEEAKAAYSRALQTRTRFPEAEVKKFIVERTELEASGAFSPLSFSEVDFSEDREAGLNRERAAQIGRIREASRERHQTWEREREFHRSAENQVTVLNYVAALGDPHRTIVVVSGLPRSGTSMMMRMLKSGGMRLQEDDRREASVHNPHGFFEWEPIKNLGENPHCISKAMGAAVKVVSSQLRFLPRNYIYKIVWMDRPIREVARSQAKMLGRTGSDELTRSEALLSKHRREVLDAIRRYSEDPRSSLSLCEISYTECIRGSNEVSRKLSEFLEGLLPEPEKAASAVDPSLHRIRVEGGPEDVR